jgi:ATP-dependent Clp protease ATP-binding subunit ClpA
MSVSGQSICRLAEAAAEADDPEFALGHLTQLRGELAEFERQQVARALTAGRSFERIARAMGVSRQAVHGRFKDLSWRRRVSGMTPTPEVRLVVEYAGAEAQALGDCVLSPPHVLLGILRNGDRTAAAALAAAGVTLDHARRAAGTLGSDLGDAGRRDIRALLTQAVQAAKRGGRDRIEVAHLLWAAVLDGDDGVAVLLHRLGTSPQEVRQALAAEPRDAFHHRERPR